MNIVIEQIERQPQGSMDRIGVVASVDGDDVAAQFGFAQEVKANAPIPADIIDRAKQRIRELAKQIAEG